MGWFKKKCLPVAGPIFLSFFAQQIFILNVRLECILSIRMRRVLCDAEVVLRAHLRNLLVLDLHDVGRCHGYLRETDPLRTPGDILVLRINDARVCRGVDVRLRLFVLPEVQRRIVRKSKRDVGPRRRRARLPRTAGRRGLVKI